MDEKFGSGEPFVQMLRGSEIILKRNGIIPEKPFEPLEDFAMQVY
ncbi:MAG: hypothetical protein WA584_03300 [Pyrinomonadaceae bacterium]